eukprot:360666-Chlamydomonas_euryale.AAC.11
MQAEACRERHVMHAGEGGGHARKQPYAGWDMQGANTCGREHAKKQLHRRRHAHKRMHAGENVQGSNCMQAEVCMHIETYACRQGHARTQLHAREGVHRSMHMRGRRMCGGLHARAVLLARPCMRACPPHVRVACARMHACMLAARGAVASLHERGRTCQLPPPPLHTHTVTVLLDFRMQ